MSNNRMVALYARVSSDHQAKNNNVDSQIDLLKAKIEADGETLIEDMMFVDAGISGATLIRPQLERLRDTAFLGGIDLLYILAPDRLSRKYAHQALLMEEFADIGIQVRFLNHDIGKTPEDEMLLQMQGMFAEYERAKIMERNRRGKLHRAKGGSVNVLSNAPFGYRYIRKQQDGQAAQYIINLHQATTVRQIFQWIGEERLSIGEVSRRLSDAGIETQTGKTSWDRSVIWGMLQNPAYMGRAAFGKTKTTERRNIIRPQKHSAETPKKPYSVEKVNREDWIEIAVPALVSEALFLTVQEQLEENRKQARQRRRGAAHLLQGLVVCGHCHYAYYGKKISPSSAKGKKAYAYYRCIGTDGYRFGGQRICDNKQIRTERLDEIVWQQVVELLKHPERLEKEHERRLDLLQQDKKVNNNDDTITLKKQKNSLDKGQSRLIDSYAEGLIDKEDFEPKIRQLKSKIQQINQQIEACQHHEVNQMELFLVVSRLEEFAKTVAGSLDSIDFNSQREIIRALVKRVEIYKEEVNIVFRIEPQNDLSGNNGISTIKGKFMRHCKRSIVTLAVQHHARPSGQRA